MSQLKIFNKNRQRFDHPLSAVIHGDFGVEPVYTTENGVLFERDCLDILPRIKSETIEEHNRVTS